MASLLRAAALAAALPLLLSACATRIEMPSETAGLRLRVQSSVIAPGNGGELIGAEVLEPGDILLTSIATVNSFGIRLGTFSPVSHAVLYLGDGLIAEAVGTGVRARRLADVVYEEQMVVAFRVPGLESAHVVGPERGAAGQTDLDRPAGRLVGACKAGRNGGGVVRDQQIAGAEELGEVVAGEAADGAVGAVSVFGVDGEQSRIGARARGLRRRGLRRRGLCRGRLCRDRHGRFHPSHPERSEGAIPPVMPPSLRSG